MLQLENVSKSFGIVQAVGPLSLTVQAGSTVVLIGPSGCGKSTLLRLMNGLLRPESGTVRFGGEDITPENERQLRQRMGYVIQSGGLFPHMTVRQNVTLMAEQLRRPKPEIDERLRELAEMVQIPQSRLNDYPAQLSGGQQQRVSLMRALMLDPDVLLLDEPLGALDPMIRHGLQEELKQIFDTLGKTVVLVTHDLGEAAFFAGEIVLLQNGEIIQRGSIHELLERPASPFVSEFVQAQRSPLEKAQ